MQISEISNIDVRKTFAAIITYPEALYALIRAIADEKDNKELEVIPQETGERDISLLLWITDGAIAFCQGNIAPKDIKLSDLQEFVRMKHKIQQRILFRAYVWHHKIFSARRPFSLYLQTKESL